MNLKRLELRGFKTFAHPTQFVFPSGITALVGPNGSGKSNFADALRWVLGEQNMRAVRGKRTEDVIFAGAPNRPPSGMAEVIITFDNDSGRLPLEYTEVSVSRRAYRSGDNEYLLNNSRVRLRDLNEVLLKAGLADSIFTIIGQGMVDLALSLRAEERRALIDEAADIKRFHVKLEETRDKLATMEQALVRARDLVAEMAPRVASLATQAAKLREHLALTKELLSLLRIWHEQIRDNLAKDVKVASATLEQSEQAAQRTRSLFDQRSREVAEIERRQAAETEVLDRLRADDLRLRQEVESLRREAAVLAERLQSRLRMREAFKAEHDSLAQSRAILVAHLRKLEATSAELEREVRELAESLADSETRHHDDLQQEESLSRSVRLANDDMVRLRARQSALEERRRSIHERQITATAEIDRGRHAMLELEQRRTNLESRAAQAQEKIDSIHAEFGRVGEEVTSASEEIARAEARLQDAGAKARKLARELDEHRARLEVLEHWRDTNSAYSTGVRSVLQAAALRGGQPPVLRGVIGVAADLLKVPAELETAIEVALGNRAQDVVVEKWRDAEAAIALLKRGGAGRATFLPLDTLRMPARLGLPLSNLQPGIRGVASELVQYDAKYEAVIAQMLGRTLVAEDLQVARRALSICPIGWQVVTLEGEIARSSGAVTGGARRLAEVGLLARHRELRSLAQRVLAIQREATEAAEAMSVDRETQAERRRQYARLDAKRREQELALRQATAVLAEIKSEARIAAEERKRTESAVARHADESRRMIDQLMNVAAEIAEVELSADSCRISLLSLEDERSKRATEQRGIAEVLSRDRATLAAKQRERTAQASLLAGRTAELVVIDDQLANKLARLTELDTESAELRSKEESVTNRLSIKEDELRLCMVSVGSAREHGQALETARRQALQDAALLRGELAEAEAAHRAASLESARLAERVDQAKEQASNDLGAAVAAETWDNLPGTGVERPQVDDLKRRLDRLRAMLRSVGMVNPQAIADHEEVSGRHDFLVREVADLEDSAKALRVLMAELQKTMRRQFASTFESVSIEFRRQFQRLFGGGSARLVLTQPDDLAETGIEIVAQPPGRRLQNLSLLSGGERALTAVALLFAVLTVRPIPFCVLDEVDAALDEANVGRFCAALRDLSRQTQFIVITHNRNTMEIADALYGVSMPADSISQVVSLRLSAEGTGEDLVYVR